MTDELRSWAEAQPLNISKSQVARVGALLAGAVTEGGDRRGRQAR